MGLFASKPEDSMREFERLRRSLRPSGRASLSDQPDDDSSPIEPPPLTSHLTVQPMGAHHASATALAAAAGPVSIVAVGTAWRGAARVDGSLRVHGELTGEVEAQDVLYVAEGAVVDARVRAGSIVVAGCLRGEVVAAERLEVTATGRVDAEVTTRALVVQDGATIQGRLCMTEKASAALPAEPEEGGENGIAALPVMETAVA